MGRENRKKVYYTPEVLQVLIFFRLNFLAFVTVVFHPSDNLLLDFFVVLGRGISEKVTDKFNCVCVFVLVGKFIAIVWQIQKLA